MSRLEDLEKAVANAQAQRDEYVAYVAQMANVTKRARELCGALMRLAGESYSNGPCASETCGQCLLIQEAFDEQ